MPIDRSMVSRTLAVLDECLDASAPVTLGDLTRSTGLPKTTSWRIAESLVARGLLARVGGAYAAGAGLISRGARAAEREPFRNAALPELADLHLATGAAAWVVDIRVPSDWVLVGSMFSRTAATCSPDDWPRDARDPAVLASALGIVAHAEHERALDELLRRGVPRLTPDTIVDPTRVLATIQRAKDDGAAVEHSRFRLGWSCLAVPIRDRTTGATVGVLGVADRTPRFTEARFLAATRAAGTSIETQLAAQH